MRESAHVLNNPAPVRSVLASPAVQGPPLTRTRGDLSPSPGQSGSLGLTRERLNASVTGLPSRVTDTIQNVRVASTHSAYDRKWNVFKCDVAHTDTLFIFSALFSDVLCVQELLDKGRAFSTVKVYLAAISVCHVGINRNIKGQHLVWSYAGFFFFCFLLFVFLCRFIRGKTA